MKISWDTKARGIIPKQIFGLWSRMDLRELAALLVLFTIIGSLWILAEEVMEGETRTGENAAAYVDVFINP